MVPESHRFVLCLLARLADFTASEEFHLALKIYLIVDIVTPVNKMVNQYRNNYYNVTIEKQDVTIPVPESVKIVCSEGGFTAISCNTLLKIVE